MNAKSEVGRSVNFFVCEFIYLLGISLRSRNVCFASLLVYAKKIFSITNSPEYLLRSINKSSCTSQPYKASFTSSLVSLSSVNRHPPPHLDHWNPMHFFYLETLTVSFRLTTAQSFAFIKASNLYLPVTCLLLVVFWLYIFILVKVTAISNFPVADNLFVLLTRPQPRSFLLSYLLVDFYYVWVFFF